MDVEYFSQPQNEPIQEDRRNDSYLYVVVGGGSGDSADQLRSSIASYHVRESSSIRPHMQPNNRPLHVQQRNLPLILSSPEEERIGLICDGGVCTSSGGRWDVICWVGDARAIPGLSCNNSLATIALTGTTSGR